jgi:protein-S-isoprenylcysteine O-methyltransferase Ste14
MANANECIVGLVSSPRINKIADFSGRIALVGIFGSLATNQTLAAIAIFGKAEELRLLDLMIAVASIAYIVLVVGLTIVRLEPIRSASGFEPRLSALAGAFLCVGLVALAPTDIGTALGVTSLALMMAGFVMSIYVLLWLGRALSVTAQARCLVVTGPYAIVRHPLYLCEEITVLGIALVHVSIAAVLIVLAQWIFQLRRMANEERVIGATFPEFAAYAANTPKIVPRAVSRKIRDFLNWSRPQALL